ncbi:hypothetical protein [Frigoriglobus tundricola]|uniref:Uncharacterized protein n=1 Tax=Frigoriglobus tundricola TaxID=2774151 RepID=A0A6M5YHW1_9BACT|nr:hypothetical protein [Frigoriglobus tundricola]QJW93124.1 hypothetical protein FTUN_0627 [Frigoriglobus tundricola]
MSFTTDDYIAPLHDDAGRYAGVLVKGLLSASEMPEVDDKILYQAFCTASGRSIAEIDAELVTRAGVTPPGLDPDKWRVLALSVDLDPATASREDIRLHVLARAEQMRMERHVQGGVPAAGATTRPTPPRPFDELAKAARALRLKGDELDIITHLCANGGTAPLPDLGALCEWDDPAVGYKNASYRINKKLKKNCWRLRRHNNVVTAIRTGRAAKKAL